MLGNALAQIKTVARSIMFAGMFVLFLPFGLLVGIGWLVPKALQFIGPMKDVI
jgi:hypothetical protein